MEEKTRLEEELKERARKRRKAEIKKKNNLIKAAKQNNYWCGPYYDEDKDRAKIIYRSKRRKNSASKKLKKVSNKKIRKEKEVLYQRGAYKKVFDYWWILD